MRWGVAVFVLCLAPVVFPTPTRAQVPGAKYSGRAVTDVQVVIERRPTSEPALLDLIETHRGDPLSLAQVRDSITHLHSLGRFQDIQVDALETAGGVELRYNLIPVHHVERVELKGTLGLSRGLLRQTIADRFGATPPVGRAADVVRAFEQLYADRGYFQARIRPVAVELHDPDRTILTFEIEAGPQTVIGRVVLSGQPQASHQATLNKIGVREGQPYERVVSNGV